MPGYASDVKNFLIGTLVGIASMLPGVSGAVVAVVFGIYERLIDDLADIFHKWRTDFRYLFAIGCGILLGMFILAFGLDFLMDNYFVFSMFFFLGLIAGQIPELYTFTPGKNFCRNDVFAFIAGLVVVSVFLFIDVENVVTLEHNIVSIVAMIIVGIILAISKLAPGISGSSVLLVLGLMAPLTAAVTEFDFFLLIPVGIGLVIGLLGFSKIMNRALKEHRSATYSMIFGMTIASLAVIAKEAMSAMGGTGDILVGILAIVLGILLSLGFVRLSAKYAE